MNQQEKLELLIEEFQVLVDNVERLTKLFISHIENYDIFMQQHNLLTRVIKGLDKRIEMQELGI